MKNILSVGVGGILGALARYYLYLFFDSGPLFPWGTLAVNLLGSFFLALFLTVALKQFYHFSFFVLAVSTGFTGAFTTFSAVSVKTVNLASVNPLFSLVYVAVSFFAGLLLACAGRSAGNLTSAAIEEKLSAREVRSVE
ncbi:MAG: fluoride efflux transporter FluC [Bacillota bacterium]